MDLGDVPGLADLLVSTGKGRATVLLIDDEEEVRGMCRRALESDGATVIGASDGEMALTLVQEWIGPLDLVIADLTMPGIGGREVAEVLSVFYPDLPVLGMTREQGRVDRRLPTLLKPFSGPELIEAARLMRTRTTEMRVWAQEQRAHAREARQIAAAMKARNKFLQNKVDLLAVALELQRHRHPSRPASPVDDRKSPALY